MKITVLYGTETGNAEMLAEDIVSSLESGHDAEAVNLSDFAPDDFEAGGFYLVVCSTYGDGELPASAKPFAEAMAQSGADLSGVSFSVFGLGDSEYDETFNHGSKHMADLLTKHGATQLGERLTHDASGGDMADDLALPWAEEMVALAEKQSSQAA